MVHTIENETLALTAREQGAELYALVKKGEEPVPLLWDGGPAWPRRAPVCFPWCSRWDEGYFEVGGRRFEGGAHGFVRDLPHSLVEKSDRHMTFRLEWAADKTRWPWSFSFETTHRVEGNRVVTQCTAVNRSNSPMPVQLGFHPGFRCPFTPGKKAEDHLIRFERREAPGGADVWPLTLGMFDDDSVCFEGLASRWMRLEERDTGRYLQVDLEGYPYALVWSKPGIPGFVCIEPWKGYFGRGHDPAKRPGATLLSPGASLTASLKITVNL